MAVKPDYIKYTREQIKSINNISQNQEIGDGSFWIPTLQSSKISLNCSPHLTKTQQVCFLEPQAAPRAALDGT